MSEPILHPMTKLAIDTGLLKPEDKGDVGEVFEAYRALRMLSLWPPQDEAAKGAARFKPPVVRTLGNVLASDPAPLDEIIPYRLERYVLGFLRGHGGTHKSRMVLQGGMSAQAGHPFFGSQPVSGLTFVHVAGEDGPDEVTRRVHRIRDGLQLGNRADQARYIDACNIGQPLFMVDDVRDGDPVYISAFGQWLMRELQGMPGHKLVALNSFYNFVRFVGQSMQNMELVRHVIQTSFTQFMRMTNSTVWTPWHSSYAGQERSDRAGFNVAFHNAPRVADSIDKMKDSDVFMLTGVKRNNGPLPLPVEFVYRNGVPSSANGRGKRSSRSAVPRGMCGSGNPHGATRRADQQAQQAQAAGSPRHPQFARRSARPYHGQGCEGRSTDCGGRGSIARLYRARPA